MKTPKRLLSIVLIWCSTFLTSCFYTEDPGPLQETQRDYSITDFDRLEMGSTFVIRVERGDFFEVKARGDVRNINDLEVFKDGSTLVVRYEDHHYRRHTTYIEITMPVLRAATFSGASNSTVNGFSTEEAIDLFLSGASTSQVDVSAYEINLVLSGASNMTLQGSGGYALNADVSGASILKAFNHWTDNADLNVSGASKANVSVNLELRAIATGASVIVYRGNPSVNAHTSGGSVVRED